MILEYIVIYDHPSDYPDHFVIRRMSQELNQGEEVLIYSDAKLFDTIDEALKTIPAGHVDVVTRFDDPVIKRVYIEGE